MKQCFIIAGANGEIGRGFVEKILPKHTVIAISKQHASQIHHPNLISVVVDLTKPEEVEKAFSGFDPTQYDQITFIHSIGIDKFENKQFPKIEPLETIDPVVYASNVNTYKYLARFLIKKIEAARKIKLVTLKFVMIGSIADKYGLNRNELYAFMSRHKLNKNYEDEESKIKIMALAETQNLPL